MRAHLARLVERLCAGLHGEARMSALTGWPGLPISDACTQASVPPRDDHNR